MGRHSCSFEEQISLAAVRSIDAFRAGNNTQLLSYFAPDATLYYHGQSANIPTLIPFAGTFQGQAGIINFLTLVGLYNTPLVVSPVRDAICACYQVYLTLDITGAPKNGSVVGTSQTLTYVAHFTFNQCAQISRLDLFTNTTDLALFFQANPVV